MILLQGDLSSMLGGMWPILLMFVVIYFFMIRPQSKKTKEQRLFIDQLSKGDEVVTGSGILGRINQIDEQSVKLQVDTKTFIQVVKSAISKEMTEAYQSSSEKE